MTGKQGRERTLIQHWWRRYAAVLVLRLRRCWWRRCAAVLVAPAAVLVLVGPLRGGVGVTPAAVLVLVLVVVVVGGSIFDFGALFDTNADTDTDPDADVISITTTTTVSLALH